MRLEVLYRQETSDFDMADMFLYITSLMYVHVYGWFDPDKRKEKEKDVKLGGRAVARMA